MRTSLSLWWSLVWRITFAVVVLSYVVEWGARLVLPITDPSWIQIRPTVFWLALAAIFWLVGAVSPRFFASAVWGDRLSLAESKWVAVSRGVAVFFVFLAILNLVVIRVTSIETWIMFKTFVAYALLLAFLGVLAFWICNADAA